MVIKIIVIEWRKAENLPRHYLAYTEPAPPPLGGSLFTAAATLDAAWRGMDPVLQAASAPYPSLGGGDVRSIIPSHTTTVVLPKP